MLSFLEKIQKEVNKQEGQEKCLEEAPWNIEKYKSELNLKASVVQFGYYSYVPPNIYQSIF